MHLTYKKEKIKGLKDIRTKKIKNKINKINLKGIIFVLYFVITIHYYHIDTTLMNNYYNKKINTTNSTKILFCPNCKRKFLISYDNKHI